MAHDRFGIVAASKVLKSKRRRPSMGYDSAAPHNNALARVRTIKSVHVTFSIVYLRTYNKGESFRA